MRGDNAHDWATDEWWAARSEATELERVDTGRLAGGVLIIGDRSDAND